MQSKEMTLTPRGERGKCETHNGNQEQRESKERQNGGRGKGEQEEEKRREEGAVVIGLLQRRVKSW
jgi:hypothetical protein